MTPFDRLRPVSAELADKGNEALKALKVSPELGCSALRIWLEKGVIRHLEERNKLLPISGTSAIERSIDRLFDTGLITKQLQGQFHQIRMHGNDAAHGDKVELTKAHSDFLYAAAIGDWLLSGSTVRARAATEASSKPASHVAAVLPSELEQFFHFRKHRTAGTLKW